MRAGRDLRDVVEQARDVARVIEDLHSRYTRFVVEQAAIGGAFDPKLLLSAEQANAKAEAIAERLDALSEETERGWSGRLGNEGYVFRRQVRGVTEAHTLDRALIGSLEARRLNERLPHLEEIYSTPRQAQAQGQRDRRLRPAHAARCHLRGRAARASACSATRASAK